MMFWTYTKVTTDGILRYYNNSCYKRKITITFTNCFVIENNYVVLPVKYMTRVFIWLLSGVPLSCQSVLGYSTALGVHGQSVADHITGGICCVHCTCEKGKTLFC